MRVAPAAYFADSAGYAAISRIGADAFLTHTPPFASRRWLGPVGSDSHDIKRRALVVVVAGWVPLVVLTVVQSAWAGPDVITSMLEEIGVHARYLIAAPLLVLAVAWCVPQLNAIVRQFIDCGIVSERDRTRFDEAITSTRGLLQSSTASVVAIGLAYGVVLATALSHSLDQLPLWARPVAGVPRYSLAGWWHMLISLPLLLVLIFDWFWRLALWTRLLWLIARLDLRLVASHPDHCAGLSFLGHSVRAFAIVALGFATIFAGRSAHLVLTGGELPTPYFIFNIAALLAICALFVAPLLVFSPILTQAWRQGTFTHDAFAHRVGQAFERKWLGANTDQDALDAPDASAVADLSSVVANVHAMRFVPVSLKDLTTIAIAMLLPFVPAVLLAFPIDVIWAQIKSLLL